MATTRSRLATSRPLGGAPKKLDRIRRNPHVAIETPAGLVPPGGRRAGLLATGSLAASSASNSTGAGVSFV